MRSSVRACVLALSGLINVAAFAAQEQYEYDELGRLRKVISVGENMEVSFTYDPAGNRTDVTSGPPPPTVPGDIEVPTHDIDGSYTVSWATSTGHVTTYELYEATNSSFTGAVLAYTGTAANKAISGKGNGTYHYRVRACNGSACSDYRAGGNPIAVTLPPGLPGAMTVPSGSTTGNYTVSWGASSGTLTAYELYEATNSDFTGAVLTYSGSATSTAITGKGNGTYHYRVRACNGSVCSAYRAGGDATAVTLPPGLPGAMTVPSGSTTGNYTVSWGASSGTLTAYQLYEATNSNFTGAVVAYSGTARSKAISGKGNGTYHYRVRACNGPACSGYRTGGDPIAVTRPPSVPGAAVVPSAYNNTGSYTVTWGPSATGNVTAYELLESVAFGGEALIYTGTARSVARSGKADGVYSYRLRACNGPACSGYTATQGNGAVIYVDKIAPTPPATVNMSAGYNLYWSGGSTDTAGSGAGSGVGSWRVYRNGSHIGTSLQPQHSFQDPAPPDNVTLNYTVRSVDRAGNVSGSSPTYSTYIDTVPPTTPGNFRATSVTVNSVALAWNPSTDAFGISWYRIARTPGGNSTTTSTSRVDGTVSANTTYTYQVFAVDGHGVESAPASVTVTTPAGAPSVPGLGGFVKDTNGSFAVTWSASSGPVAYYVLEEDVGSSSFASFTPYTINAPTRSKSFSGKGSGEHYYRVKACTSGGLCSGYSGTRRVLVCIGACP